MSLFRQDGRVALITGASSGLGKSFATLLAEQGAAIAIAARRLDKLEELAQTLRAVGVRCLPIQCDVSQEADVVRMVSTVQRELGTIDILVNNAGISKAGAAVSISMADYDAVLNTNSRAVFLVARESAKVMIPKKYGRIINVASMYGLVANKFNPAASYHTSKGSLVNMTRALAAEWAAHGITVNALCPGFFASELTASFMNTPEFLDFVKTSCCLERLGKGDELDTALLFLAASKSSYITGQTVVVDGGWTSI